MLELTPRREFRRSHISRWLVVSSKPVSSAWVWGKPGATSVHACWAAEAEAERANRETVTKKDPQIRVLADNSCACMVDHARTAIVSQDPDLGVLFCYRLPVGPLRLRLRRPTGVDRCGSGLPPDPSGTHGF